MSPAWKLVIKHMLTGKWIKIMKMRINKMHTRHKRGYKFTDKKQSKRGIAAWILSVISLGGLIAVIACSFQDGGNGSMYLGSAGVSSMFVGVIALFNAIVSLREENSYRFLRIKIVNISPATRDLQISTACSATARFICWGGSAGETSPIGKRRQGLQRVPGTPPPGELWIYCRQFPEDCWRDGGTGEEGRTVNEGSSYTFRDAHEKSAQLLCAGGRFLDIGSRSFNKVAGRHPVSEGCCPPYC